MVKQNRINSVRMATPSKDTLDAMRQRADSGLPITHDNDPSPEGLAVLIGKIAPRGIPHHLEACKATVVASLLASERQEPGPPPHKGESIGVGDVVALATHTDQSSNVGRQLGRKRFGKRQTRLDQHQTEAFGQTPRKLLDAVNMRLDVANRNKRVGG